MDSNNKYLIHLISFFIAIGIFCGSKLAHSASKAESTVLVEVNGKKITRATYDDYVKRRGLPKDIDSNTQARMIIDELINRELIVQDAVKKEVDKSPRVKRELANMRMNILAGEMLKNASDSYKVTEKEIKKQYDGYIKTLNNKEYKASHILLKTKKDADAVINDLNKGKNFKKLAKAKSTGPSAPNGGDLGWFRPEQMVKPFSDAVAELKKGKYSKTPVKTDFGWHVILKEDMRTTDAPKYQDLKEQIRMRLQNKGVEAYIGSLRKKAKIVKK